MQAVIPGEGRHARMERLRNHFRNAKPASRPTSRKISMAEAAARFGMHEETLKSILYRARNSTKEKGKVELCYDFKAAPIWLEKGKVFRGIMCQEGFDAIRGYLELRALIWEKALLPVSRAIAHNPSITARSRWQIEVLDNFALSHLELEDGATPLLRLSPVGHGLRVPVREYRDILYSYPDYLEPIVFASRILYPFHSTQFAEIDLVRKEAAKAEIVNEISVSLGMRLWIMREIFADPDFEGAFSPRNFALMEEIFKDPVVLRYFADSYNKFIDPKIRVGKGGFLENSQKTRKIFPDPPEKTE